MVVQCIANDCKSVRAFLMDNVPNPTADILRQIVEPIVDVEYDKREYEAEL